MRLTKEKLLASWKVRKQLFSAPYNEFIINRFEAIQKLFHEIELFDVSFDEDGGCLINGKELFLVNGDKPSTNYFSCKDDDMTASEAFTGVKIMSDNLPPEYKEVIINIGCLLGGFTFDNRHVMKDEFRIISNTITSGNDTGSLYSIGQTRHPSSHFADNNYFFNVINTINDIRKDQFEPNDTKLVLRWPNSTYYTDDVQAEKSQKETLRFRFPYKFFYMWTHDVLHPVSLMAYKNLVLQDDELIRYPLDESMNQDFSDFISETGWIMYSAAIRDMIPEDERGDNFWNEMSKLLSIIMLQEQEMKNIQELLETGNKAIILYGPPGTGKTYHAHELIRTELGIHDGKMDVYRFDINKEVPEKGAWTFVQFHPNYTYEDFIGGISPKLTGDHLSYTLKEGIFKQFCDAAAEKDNRDKKFIIVIDEINRADLSAVFGELMYALEYRDRNVSIPNFPEPFVIPSNVYLIGTMNSIDKSLVTFDLALRRRFSFIKIMPNVAAIENMLCDYCIDETCLVNFIKRCKKLNERISSPSSRLQLGADYQIGHAYFGKIKDFKEKRRQDEEAQIITTFDLEKLWDYHLQPLLEEYLGNRVEDKEIKDLLQSIRDEFTKPLK